MLSQKQVEQYRYNGYLFPFPALSAAELAECNDGLARFESWLGKPVNQGDFRWRSASYVILPWVDALVRHPRILDAVEDLIGPDILVYTATWFIKEALSPTFAAWHQDATYFGLDPHGTSPPGSRSAMPAPRPVAWRWCRRKATRARCITRRCGSITASMAPARRSSSGSSTATAR
jgi:hypothetical protein